MQNAYTHTKFSTLYDSHTSQNKSSQRIPLAHNSNGASLVHKSSREMNEGLGVGNAKTGGFSDTGYLAPNRTGASSRQESSVRKKRSEPDSLLDLYGNASSRSNLNSMDYGERKGSNSTPNREEEDLESAKWIHRDKLAKIESEELQQAGIQLPYATRSGMKAGSSTRGQSAEQHDSNGTNGVHQTEPWLSARDEKRQRVPSPAPVVDEGEDIKEEEPMSYDLRTPEEIAADPYEHGGPSKLYINQTLKKSTSRIPVLTSSPLPIPQEHIERETPLQRSRRVSMGDEEGIEFSKGRNRSHSASSQALLYTSEPAEGTPTPASGSRPGSKGSNLQSSPTKTKGLAKAGPPGTRKITPTPRKPSNAPKPRTTSNTTNSQGQRPVTRSGEGRPSTAVNRPEGEAPWIATMYKPDPRLPPDQQIIPTHAKRQQAEQWEKEGAYPTTYDRAFSPLAVHTSDGLKPPSSPIATTTNEDEEGSWPLKTARSTPDLNNRPGTSGTDHAGYSTMPKVQNTPPIGLATSPKLVQQQMRVQEPPLQQQIEVRKDNEKKEKACGCCIVM